MKKLILMMSLLLIASLSFAQDALQEAQEQVGETAFILTAPFFFVAIIAGLILALAFELLLTNLSAAIGLNVAGVKLKPERKRGRRTQTGKTESEPMGERITDTLDSAQGKVRSVSNWFGFWTLITASISLFFSSWLAVLISGTFSLLFGALLGLVIWGLFYVILLTLETRLVTSMVGTLTTTAKSALQNAYHAATSIFTRSEEKKVVDTATEVAAAVQRELFGKENLKDQLQKYFNRMEQTFSPRRIREEIQNALNDTEIEYLYKGGGLEEDRVVASISAKGGISREQARTAVKSVMDAVKTIRDEQRTGKSRAEKVSDAAMEIGGLSREQAETTRRKIEDYLRNTHKEELDPDGIKRDLDKLLSEPRAGLDAFKERLSHFDRSTVTALLAQRKDMSQEEAQRTVDKFMNVFNDYMNKIETRLGIVEKSGETRMHQIENKLRNFFDSLGKPELQYSNIKHDVEQLFHDPRAGAESLLNRVKSIDRATIKSMLAQRKDISNEDAERIINQVEAARDSVINRATKMKDEVQHRIEQIREESLHQAEEASQTAAIASWWAFATAVISAGFAILGGMMPVLV